MDKRHHSPLLLLRLLKRVPLLLTVVVIVVIFIHRGELFVNLFVAVTSVVLWYLLKLHEFVLKRKKDRQMRKDSKSKNMEELV